MKLSTYLETVPRGAGVVIARAVGVHPVMVSQWAKGTKPIPEDRAPSLEAATGGAVRCEDTCPGSIWVRVPCEGWPAGKPLLDKTAAAPAQAGA